jgi:hypothetical protein
MELDPERGARCTMCFDMRMERTAEYALEHGFQAFTTTNATSRWKDIDQVNASGIRVAQRLARNSKAFGGKGSPPVYWIYDWQTEAMTQRKYEISAQEKFYKQEYCGCSFSLRDSNAWRQKEGLPPVRIGGEEAGIGSRWFQDAKTDAAEESQEVVDAFFTAARDGGLLDEKKKQRFKDGRFHSNESAKQATW